MDQQVLRKIHIAFKSYVLVELQLCHSNIMYRYLILAIYSHITLDQAEFSNYISQLV